MADPIIFSSKTRNAGLPLLFSGQAQKEFFLNQSLVVFDAVLPKTVQGVVETPPEDTNDGDCFLVGSSPSGDWLEKSDYLAIRMGEGWHFLEPFEGMEVFDTVTRRKLVYLSQWYQPVAPSEPSGGAMIDTEARVAINDLIIALKNLGIIG